RYRPRSDARPARRAPRASDESIRRSTARRSRASVRENRLSIKGPVACMEPNYRPCELDVRPLSYVVRTMFAHVECYRHCSVRLGSDRAPSPLPPPPSPLPSLPRLRGRVGEGACGGGKGGG